MHTEHVYTRQCFRNHTRDIQSKTFDLGGRRLWPLLSFCYIGRGLKVRTRLYMVSPQHQTNVECKVQLMEKATCEGARPECAFDDNDAKFICSLKKVTGPCKANYPRWYFDLEKHMCVQFMYGGCRGNSNNFERYAPNYAIHARLSKLVTDNVRLIMLTSCSRSLGTPTARRCAR